MNAFHADEEIAMCQLIDKMTAEGEFWHPCIPSQVKFQRFGYQLRETDFEPEPADYREFKCRNRSEVAIENSGFSIVNNGEKEFEIKLDVWPFKLHQISAMVMPNKYVAVKGEHGEIGEDASFVSRKFQRYYRLPKGTNSKSIKCDYASNTLTIRVVKDGVSDERNKPEIVPITLVTSRNVPVPTDERYDREQMSSVQAVPIHIQSEAVVDLETEIPIVTEDSKSESSKPEGERDQESTEGVSETTEDLKNEESSKSEGEQDRQSPEGVSEGTQDPKSEESSKELSSPDQDESEPGQKGTESSESTPMEKDESAVDVPKDEKVETTIDDAGK